MKPAELRTGSQYRILFLLFAALYLFQVNKVGSDYNRFNKIINEDAFGYYVVLPAFFKYQDPEFAFLDSVLRKTDAYASYRPPVVNQMANGQKVCKYYSGVALLQLPFYLICKAITPANYTGFEPAFHFAILCSAVFYLLFGFYILSGIMRRFAIPPLLAFLLITATLFGSNLLAYATYDIAYSHVYSFFALVSFCAALLKLKEMPGRRNAILAGLLYGLIILIRPLNGVAIFFLPIMFPASTLIAFFKTEHILKPISGILSAFSVLSIQSALWYWQTGSLIVYPYGHETLNLSDPKLFELIFGFNCGWAVYSPLPFLMLMLSIVFLFVQKAWRQGIWTMMTSSVILYLLSCWYYLHYGCTLGCRPITEFYGPLLFLFTYTVRHYTRLNAFRFGFLPLAGLLTVYNLILHKQFFETIINPCDMDRKRFGMVFLKTHEAYRYSCSPFWDFSAYNSNPVLYELPLNRTLQTGKQKEKDTLTLVLPPMEARDSALLFEVDMQGIMRNDINESYLRILLTDNGAYKDLLNLLLRRKISVSDAGQNFTYQFHVPGSLPKGKLNLSLESVDGQSETLLRIRNIRIKKIPR